MRVELRHPSELDAADLAQWARLRACDPRFASPFQAPGFALAAGAARRDARVLMLRGQDDALDVVLPMQVAGSGLARALGAPMCDVNGPLVSKRARNMDFGPLLAQAGIAAFAFTGWPGRAPDAARGRAREGCAVAGLSHGFGRYLEAQRERFPKHFKKMRRLGRQAEKEFGAATVTFGRTQMDDLARLIAWKRTQYVRTGRHDVLGAEWTRKLLANCALADSDDFSGVMATLRLGGRLAAAEFGLRSGSVLHGWIAGYDPAFASVSPGLILQERLLEAAAASGVTDAVLGVGEAHYKDYYCSWQAPLDAGLVTASGLVGQARGWTGDLWRVVERGEGRMSQLALRTRRRLDVILAVETSPRDQIGGFLRAVRREPAVVSTGAALTALASAAPPT